MDRKGINMYYMGLLQKKAHHEGHSGSLDVTINRGTVVINQGGGSVTGGKRNTTTGGLEKAKKKKLCQFYEKQGATEDSAQCRSPQKAECTQLLPDNFN